MRVMFSRFGFRQWIGAGVLGLLPFLVCGQTTIQPKQIDYSMMGVLYNKEHAIDLQVHTNGFALAYNVGEIRKYYLTRYKYFGFGMLKHPREYRQSVNFHSGNLLLKSSSSFTFGKQNNFLIARVGMGEKRYFSEKAKRKGVAVGISYEGGFSLGILKPYYLILNKLENSSGGSFTVTEKYSEDNAEYFLDVSRIQGAASFFKGIGEIKIIPGLHGKFGAHFSMGAFEKSVRALEVGVMFDLYFKRVPIMIIENNQPLFLNLYATLQLGKRS